MAGVWLRKRSLSSRVGSLCVPSTSVMGPAAQACISPGAPHKPLRFPCSGLQRRGWRHSGHSNGNCCIVCVCVHARSLCFEWQLLAGETESVFNSNSCLGLLGASFFGGGGGRATNDVYKLPWIPFQCKPLSSGGGLSCR